MLWNPDSGAEDLEYPRANKLIIKQILLGVEAKENEYNVVEVNVFAAPVHFTIFCKLIPIIISG